MKNDPIVEEVHRVRQKMLRECGGDIKKLIEHIRTFASENPNRVASPAELKKLIESKARG